MSMDWNPLNGCRVGAAHAANFRVEVLGECTLRPIGE
jgi:hypothetical protein